MPRNAEFIAARGAALDSILHIESQDRESFSIERGSRDRRRPHQHDAARSGGKLRPAMLAITSNRPADDCRIKVRCASPPRAQVDRLPSADEVTALQFELLADGHFDWRLDDDRLL